MTITSNSGNILLDTGAFPPCVVATTGSNIALAGVQTIDGVSVGNNAESVLVKDQTDQTTNGIYIAQSGNWVRRNDASSNARFAGGMLVPIFEGAQNAGQIFVLTCADNPVLIGTSLLTFMPQSTLLANQLSATSATSLAVGIGSVTFTTQAGKAFAVGQWILAQSAGTPSAQMYGQITGYSGTSLVVSVVATGGSGTHADWNLVLSNSAAAAGYQPPVGTGNVTGPGSATAGHLATFADTTGKVLADSGLAAGTLAGRNQLLYGDAGTRTIPQAALASDAVTWPLVGVQGSENFLLANDGTNPTRDVDISPGRVMDDTDVLPLRLVGTMVKRFDQSWAAGGLAGSPAGACDSGSKGNSQTWHLYVIGTAPLTPSAASRTSNVATITIAGHGLGVGGTIHVQGFGSGFDGRATITAVTTNTVSYANTGANTGAITAPATAIAYGFDVLASRSYPSPTMPSGWNYKQCLGSVLTDGSANVRAFLQFGQEFYLVVPVADLSNESLGGTYTLASIPKGVKVKALFNVELNSFIGTAPSSQIFIYPPDVGNTSAGSYTVGFYLTIGSSTNLNISPMNGNGECWTNTSGQVGIGFSGNTFNLITLGWRDPRRRLF